MTAKRPISTHPLVRPKRKLTPLIASALERGVPSRRALVGGTLFFLAAGAGTFLFWIFAVTGGLVNVGESGLYLIRGAGLVGLMLGALGLLILLGAFQRVALPIADMKEAAERVAAGEYDLQVQERGPRELRTLAHSFNQMTEQLKTRERAQRQLDAAVAQDLLSTFRVLESGVGAVLQNAPSAGSAALPVIAAANHLSGMVEDWDTLTRASGGELSLQRELADIGELVRDTLAALHPDASARGIALRAVVPDPAPKMNVDPAILKQAFAQVLLDALARNANESQIRVSVSQLASPRRVELAVTDTGKGFTPEQLAHFFDGCALADGGSARLGVAVARALVKAHGGEIFANSQVDAGTTITFAIPFKGGK